MGPEELVPSLLFIGALPSLPVYDKPLPIQKERMASMALPRAEMTTITTVLRIEKALRSELPPAIQNHFKPGDLVRVYKEQVKKWCGPVIIMRCSNKEITVPDGMKAKNYGISQALPYQTNNSDRDLKSLLSGLRK